MSQNNDITEKFLTACSIGDLASVVHLYSNHYLRYKHIKNKILAALYKDNILYPHCHENLPFRYASSNGHSDIVSYLLSHKHFAELVSQQDLSIAVGIAISINDINSIKAIEPYIKNKDKEFFNYIAKGFIEACQEGHLEAIMYVNNNLNNENYLDYCDIDFPNIYEDYINKTIKEAGFLKACEYEQEEVVKFLLSDGSFSKKINNPVLSMGLSETLAKNNTDLINLIATNIQDKNVHYYYNMGTRLITFCDEGNLEAIKYMLNSKSLNLDYIDLFNRPLGNGTNSIILECFKNACRHGKLNVVKYLTTSEDLPIHINVKELSKQKIGGLTIKGYEVMQYLIFDLNLERKECFMLFRKEFEIFFEKKKLKNDLESELTENNTLINKRQKI
jgi:hypothetical protein